MAAADKNAPELAAHKAWLGLVQPVGLVVAPLALAEAQVFPDKNVAEIQQILQGVLSRPASIADDADPVLTDFPRFAQEVLGWTADDLAGAPDGPALPERLSVHLPDYGETLRPSFAVIDAQDQDKVLMLVSIVAPHADLDKPPPAEVSPTGWHASPQARLERLLRDTDTAAGILCSGTELRLVYAPRGESSGHIGFPIAELTTVGGRPILSALLMLLSEHRVFGAPDGQRLLDLMAGSRKYQSTVSNRLSEQVLGALWELLRGVQAADEAANGRVLHGLPRTDPGHIYGGLLTVIMRLVFLLYAEDRGLMPDDPVYARNYAIGGLYERLREDEGRHPDTMDQRFGAWAWLLSIFRMVFDGGGHGDLRLPTRHGQLFNPDEYPFLEGRPPGSHRVMGETFDAPRVSDGVVWRVLKGLLLLSGERLSYRALDVEQIGSVYEAMMGFDVRTLRGRAIALRPKNIVIDLDTLLALPSTQRPKWLKEEAECDLPAAAEGQLKAAKTIEDVLAALDRRIAPQTPRPLPPGALFLQPGEERRRSGSHYTPRELTEPIVRTTLRPVLESLGPRPTPDQILDLKVCDPAMGSGAFLVEACRQIAEALVHAWDAHSAMPPVPPDEDPLLLARRLVAQRCLYGVDKNPFAVNLAKLSLWLVTLARDHAFTFLDHALRHGDSLVGLTREQIGAFHWSPPQRDWGPLFKGISASVDEANRFRGQILSAGHSGDGDYDQRSAAWRDAEDALHSPRITADLCISAFFGADKDKDREALRLELRQSLDLSTAPEAPAALRDGDHPLSPFHWEIEFPEVFARNNPGFDAIVGNPPFAGKNTTIHSNRSGFLDWLKVLHPESHGNADLVAHFYRRAFGLLRERGTFGLIATNTIGQGDTRTTGLRWICAQGDGTIYAATRRVNWPGIAAVVVSVVHVLRGPWQGPRLLDGRPVPQITAFLFHGGGHENPATLAANASKSFQGSIILGMGFTFDDTDKNGVATPIDEMNRLIARDPRNAERIFPYIGGQEVNSSPTHSHHRYVINFGEMTEDEARQWPDLMAIVEAKVRPERMKNNREGYRRYWWQYGEKRVDLFRAIDGLDRVLAIPQTSNTLAFSFQPTNRIWGHTVILFPIDNLRFFSVLQSNIHRRWVEMFAARMKDDLRYIPTDCFETFPFPGMWKTSSFLQDVGQTYYDFRADLMVRNDEGLTKTYNRFHDPDERAPDILRLRELHAEMDRAVLNAYGWTDISTDCDFFLDYEIDEETWGNKKRPYRYRWPDEVCDEVLARLLDLNQKRYQEEVLAGQHAKEGTRAVAKKEGAKGGKASKKGGASRGKAVPSVVGVAVPLFGSSPGEGDEG